MLELSDILDNRLKRIVHLVGGWFFWPWHY